MSGLQAASKERRAFYCSTAAAVLLTSNLLAVRAEEEIKYVDVMERDAFFKFKHFAPVYDKRITNIRDQIDMALNKGWIGSGEADRLRGECSRLAATAEGLGKDPPQAQADEMEKSITRLNADLYQAMKGGSPSPATASEPKSIPTSAPSPPAPSDSNKSSGSTDSFTSSSNTGISGDSSTSGRGSGSSGSGSTASSAESTAGASAASTGSTYGMGASAAGVVPMKALTRKK